MNNYITLGSKRYSTKANKWDPRLIKPSTIRAVHTGSMDATYGPVAFKVWEGDIKVRANETRTEYGTVTNLESSLATMGGITFIDHYGTSYTVHIQEYQRGSLTPVWDGASNVLFYNVRLQGK